jgi:hypothetical protein
MQLLQTATHLHPQLAATGQNTKHLIHLRRRSRPVQSFHVAASSEHAGSSSGTPLHQQLLGGVHSAASRVDPRQLLGKFTEQQQQQQALDSTPPVTSAFAGQTAAAAAQSVADFPAQLLRLVADAGRSVPGLQLPGPDAPHGSAANCSDQTPAVVAAEGSASFSVVSGHQQDLVSHLLWPSEAAAAAADEGDWGAPPATTDWMGASSSSTQGQAFSHDPFVAARSSPANLPAATAPSNSSSSSSSLRFVKHLATLSNGGALPSTRLESLGWLLFESQRQQAALGLAPPPAAADVKGTAMPSSSSSGSDQVLALQAQQWLATAESRRLLEEVRWATICTG